MTMNKKNNRMQAILDIINTMDISGQAELRDELARRGHHLTQATLSRNLKEMGISKITDNEGKYRYVKHVKEAPKYLSSTNFIYVGYKSVDFSGTTVIIKTNPGYASMIADELDRKFVDIVLGTVAGDDTIFAILVHEKYKELFLDRLSKTVPMIR